MHKGIFLKSYQDVWEEDFKEKDANGILIWPQQDYLSILKGLLEGTLVIVVCVGNLMPSIIITGVCIVSRDYIVCCM